MNAPSSRYARQRGVTLIVALIFLVVLGLLGVSGAMNNTLQERMAGNTRNRDLAFQAAEHALMVADAWIKHPDQTKTAMETAATSTPNDGIRDHGEDHPNDASYWHETFDWTSSDLIPVSLPGLEQERARYVIEKMPSGRLEGDADCPNVVGGPTCDFYRITARGVGGISDTVVILQTMYRFTP